MSAAAHRVSLEVPPACPCGRAAELADSAEVYGGRSYGPIWLCRPCRAYVGCHGGTTNPLGTLADAETRDWRKRCHAVFDPMWQRRVAEKGCSKSRARSEAYAWLAERMGIPREECHVAMFDADRCRRALEVMLADQRSEV